MSKEKKKIKKSEYKTAVKYKLKKLKKLEYLPPKYKMVVDDYLLGTATQSNIAKRHKMSEQQLSSILNQTEVVAYIKAHYKSEQKMREDSFRRMSSTIRRAVQRQIERGGRMDVSVTKDSEGNVISTQERCIELSVRDMVEIAKLAGEYNPNLTLHGKSASNKDEDYKQVLAQIRSWKRKGA